MKLVRLQHGYTLIEMVIVVTVLAVIAAIAVPVASPRNDKQLELAAQEFAAAIRFARTESIRTGLPHGFQFDTSQYRIRVFSAATSGSPWTSVWDIYHPIDKQLYDYTFPASLVGAGTPVTHSHDYRGTCVEPGTIYFDRNGSPWCLEPETILLNAYQLDLVGGSTQATVSLDGITGRVTVQ